MTAKYVNPYTDFGFKKLFGEEASKELLLDFLNEVLPDHLKIAELSLKSTEKLGNIESDRKAIFDIYCESKDGQKFIVELQKAKINFFKDRTVFYSTFPIQEQAEKGEWDYRLNPVYCIAILDFTFDNKNQADYLNKVQLKNQYCEVFYDKLTFIFIEMPLFNKTENELKTHFEKWLYFLKNLEDFNDIPAILNEPIFQKGFEIASIANFTKDQMDTYQQSLKVYRDLKGVVNTSYMEGKLEGKLEGKMEGEKEKGMEIAKKMLEDGEPMRKIMKYTGLSSDEINKLI